MSDIQLGFVTCKVVGPEGEVLPESCAIWRDQEGAFARASADENGCVRIGPLTTTYPSMIWLECSGLARRRLDFVTVAPHVEQDLGKFSLAAGPKIRAQVMLPDGTPAQSGEATLNLHYNTLAHTVNPDGPALALCINNGILVSPTLPPGHAHLSLNIAGCARHDLHFAITADFDGDIEAGTIELEKERRLAGCVVGPSGQPIPGARIRMLRTFSAIIADENGNFELTGLGTEAEMTQVGAQGFASQVIEVVPSSEKLEIKLASVRKIRGMVVDAETDKLLPIEDMTLSYLIRFGDQAAIKAG